MFRRKNIISFCLVLFICTIVLIPLHFSYADDSIIGGTSPGCQATGDCELNDFVKLFSNYSTMVLTFVGSLALVMVIYGGVVMLISAGNSEKVTQGKQILISAVIGIIITFSSYMIIQFALESLGVVNDQGQFNNMEGEWSEAPQ